MVIVQARMGSTRLHGKVLLDLCGQSVLVRVVERTKRAPRLDDFIARRREIVARYNAAFADVPWLTRPGLCTPASRDHISWHLYTVQIDFSGIRKTRTRP